MLIKKNHLKNKLKKNLPGFDKTSFLTAVKGVEVKGCAGIEPATDASGFGGLLISEPTVVPPICGGEVGINGVGGKIGGVAPKMGWEVDKIGWDVGKIGWVGGKIGWVGGKIG